MVIARFASLIYLLFVCHIAFSGEVDPQRPDQLWKEIYSMHKRSKTIAVAQGRKEQGQAQSDFSARELERLAEVMKDAVGTLRGMGYCPSEKDLNKALLRLAYSGPIDEIDVLIEWGANVDARNDKGRTPAMCACVTGNYRALQRLIQHNADVRLVDRDGKSTLLYTTHGMVHRTAEDRALRFFHQQTYREGGEPLTRCRELIEKVLNDQKNRAMAAAVQKRLAETKEHAKLERRKSKLAEEEKEHQNESEIVTYPEDKKRRSTGCLIC